MVVDLLSWSGSEIIAEGLDIAMYRPVFMVLAISRGKVFFEKARSVRRVLRRKKSVTTESFFVDK
jgi:hypothetical protein